MINRLTVFTFHNSNASEVKLFEVLTEQIANIIQVIYLVFLCLEYSTRKLNIEFIFIIL